jgi:hypothetical protein
VEACVHSCAFAGPYAQVGRAGGGAAASEDSREAVPSFPGHTDTLASSAGRFAAFDPKHAAAAASVVASSLSQWRCPRQLPTSSLSHRVPLS